MLNFTQHIQYFPNKHFRDSDSREASYYHGTGNKSNFTTFLCLFSNLINVVLQMYCQNVCCNVFDRVITSNKDPRHLFLASVTIFIALDTNTEGQVFPSEITHHQKMNTDSLCKETCTADIPVTLVIWKAPQQLGSRWHLLCCCVILAVGFGSWLGVFSLLWPDIISPEGQSQTSQLNNRAETETMAQKQSIRHNCLRWACFTVLAGYRHFSFTSITFLVLVFFCW